MSVPPLSRILYVEDDPDIRTIVQIALEVGGDMTVRTCASGHDALEQAPEFAPDLILLDVMMPGMDGRQALRALRELPQTRATPVVFVTARVQAPDFAQYRELGAIDVILKPFDPMKLATEVRGIWERHHGGR